MLCIPIVCGQKVKTMNEYDEMQYESNVCSLRRTQSLALIRDQNRQDDLFTSFGQFQSKIIPRAKLMGKTGTK